MNLKGGASDDGIFICIRRQEAHIKHLRPIYSGFRLVKEPPLCNFTA